MAAQGVRSDRRFRQRPHGRVEHISVPGLSLRAAALLLTAAVSHAADQPRPQYPEPTLRSIEPVNVEVSYIVVAGTVTVRAGGVLVNPQEVTYMFQPEFVGSRGYLYRVAEGTYRLRVSRVPSDGGHSLVIRAAYNNTVVKDRIVERLGQTYTGTLRIDIPNGRDCLFGEQLLDLR